MYAMGMNSKRLARLLTLLMLLSSVAPAVAGPPGNRSRTSRVSRHRALKVTWRLTPFSCHRMELSATKLPPKKKKKSSAASLLALQVRPSPAALRVTMVDGKVLRKLASDREPITRRLCSGSNTVVVRLSIRSTVSARATARLVKVKLNLPPRARDAERRAWAAASGLFISPFPAGDGRTLIRPAARFLGQGSLPMSARLNLARGHCYHLQLRAEAGGPLQLTVSDADEKTLLAQSLSPKANSSQSSDKICPRRTEAHRLILSGAGQARAVAWRLVARPLGRGPMARLMMSTTGSPELEPCLMVKNARSKRYVCGGGLVGVGGARRKSRAGE